MRRLFPLALAACANAHPYAARSDAGSDPDAVPLPVPLPVPDAGSPSPPDASPPDAVVPTYPPLDFEPVNGSFSGLSVYLHVPPGMAIGTPRPLVLVLHGCWESAAVHAANSGWNQLADARHVYVAYVQENAQSQQCLDWWTAAAQAGGGDTAGALAAIDSLRASYDIDDSVIYLDGFSSGAAVAINLVARHPDRFAGAIVNAALPFAGYTGTDVGTLGYIFSEHDQTPAARAAAMPGPGPYPPIVAFVGTADTTVHPTYTRELVDQWTAIAGADQTADVVGQLDPDHATHVYREYLDGDGALVIATVTIDGMAHGYAVAPGGAGPAAGGATDAHLGSHPSYGLDVGLWSAYWGAEVLHVGE
jgi:poly(hydroxyalkanoate) depolymerase family esterase